MQQHPIILPFGIIDEVMDGPWLGSWPWRNLSSELRRRVFTSQLPHSDTQNVRWGTILKDPCGSVHHYSGSIRHKWRYDGRSRGLRVVLADGAVLPVTSCFVCNTRQWKGRRRVEDSSGKKNIIIHCQHHHCLALLREKNMFLSQLHHCLALLPGRDVATWDRFEYLQVRLPFGGFLQRPFPPRSVCGNSDWVGVLIRDYKEILAPGDSGIKDCECILVEILLYYIIYYYI